MHKLMELKEMLCKELEEYGERDNLDVGGLDVVDKLAHAIKNIDKIIEAEEYSGRSSRGSYEGGRSYEGGYGGRSYEGGYGGRSYEGGRSSYEGRSYEGGRSRGRGRSSRRDSMGRYSSAADELQRLIDEAPDEQTRMELERMMQRFE